VSRHVHILGICGYATSGAAFLAQAAGDRVTGSDDHAYPPVTDSLTGAGIAWENHSDPANLERWGIPDLVVVGNQTRQHNPEWIAVQQRKLPYTSEIEFYTQLADNRLRLAVCGTHGKTTTSSLLLHMLDRAGMNPGFRLGSTSLDVGGSAGLGTGPFVFEGDEYTTAPWDRRPKFLHTRPDAAAVTRLELDHPDVYPTLESYRAPFIDLARDMPSEGMLVLCADDAECAALAVHAPCSVVLYGADDDADWVVRNVRSDGGLQRFDIVRRDTAPRSVALTFPGLHNALNACAALALAGFAGVPEDAAVAACADFRGPARRFQILNPEDDVVVVDDYAHHPTEVAAAIDAARQRFAGRRLIAVHTPHTYSRTRTMIEEYSHVFNHADVVLLGPIEPARERGQEPGVSITDVAERITGRDVVVVDSSDAGIAVLTAMAQPGDVMLVLSLGGFDKFAPRLRAALEGAHATR